MDSGLMRTNLFSYICDLGLRAMTSRHARAFSFQVWKNYGHGRSLKNSDITSLRATSLPFDGFAVGCFSFRCNSAKGTAPERGKWPVRR
jgi:hypothetical protein